MEQARRSKRQRVAVDYARLDTSGFADCMRVQHKKLTRAVLKFTDQPQEESPSFTMCILAPSELAPHVHSTGFVSPCVVRSFHDARNVLGISMEPGDRKYCHPLDADVGKRSIYVFFNVRAAKCCNLFDNDFLFGVGVPEGEMTVDRVAELVGRNRHINTIDVSTQLVTAMNDEGTYDSSDSRKSEGPVYTMDELAAYFATPSPRKPLLNVVSLDLANTSLHDMVSAPSLVQELDLVNKAWPPSEAPTPMVQLYALMSAAGCFMDFHVDFGGSSVWYHVLSGSKVFLLVPPTKGNLMAFEEWSSSDRQASVFFADRTTGCQKLALSAGDTLLLPGGWPHCVVTPEDSVVLGGNFLTGYNLSLQLNIWQMEERLKVRSKFRFPLYKQLMWHTAAHYLALLQQEDAAVAENSLNRVSKGEKEGLVNLCQCLDSWLRQSKDGGDVVGKHITDPSNLVKDLEACLKKEGFEVAAGDASTPQKIRLTLRPLSAERPVSEWTTFADDEDSEEEKPVEDKDDGEFDPTKDGLEGDDLDADFQLEDDKCIWSKQQRTPSIKKKVTLDRRQPAVAPIVKANIAGSPRVATLPKKLMKNNSSVRDRLLKKCGIDPRIPLPTPKFKSKQTEG